MTDPMKFSHINCLKRVYLLTNFLSLSRRLECIPLIWFDSFYANFTTLFLLGKLSICSKWSPLNPVVHSS